MILNLLYDKNNIVKLSSYSNASSNLISENYTTKTTNDLKSWKLYSNATSGFSAAFTIISNDVSFLLDIEEDPNVSYNTKIIETSIDMINWYELPYKKDNAGTIYKYFDTNGSSILYTNIETNNIEEFDSTSKPSKYEFKKLNTYTNEYEYLYDNFQFQFIRFTYIFNQGYTQESLSFYSTLNIFISEEFDTSYTQNYSLTNRASSYYRSKYFEEKPFLSSLIDNFSSMLEINNPIYTGKEFQTVFFQKSIFEISDLDEKTFGSITENIYYSLPIGQAKIEVSNAIQ